MLVIISVNKDFDLFCTICDLQCEANVLTELFLNIRDTFKKSIILESIPTWLDPTPLPLLGIFLLGMLDVGLPE